MNTNQKLEVSVSNEKTGIGMIISSLLVILFAVGIFLHQQKTDAIGEIHRQGSGLVRLLGNMSVAQLSGEANNIGALRLLKEVRFNHSFAYASVVDVDGLPFVEFSTPDVVVPSAFIPDRPSQWVGEREYQSGSGVSITEFFAPVMNEGELQAFIRLGYREPGYTLSTAQVRLLAILAMLIFMLTPIFYFMVKKEITPLIRIGSQLQTLVSKTKSVDTDISNNENTQELMKKFSTVVEAAYNHIDVLEEKQTNSVVSCKLLVYQRERLESAFNALPFAILVIDESGQITYTSNKTCDLLGTHEGEVLGRNLADLSQNRELSEYLVNCQTSNAVNMYQNNESDIYLPESDKRVSVSPYPLYSHKNENQLLGTVIVFRDTTHEEVNQNNNGDFIAHVAHELKTPLNVLFMYSEVLLDNADASREVTIEAANVIHDETGRISQMIDNLLNLAMIEMGTVTLHRQRVKAGEFLQDIYQSMSHSKDLESLEFDLKLPHDLGALSIDKDLIRVSINNLISNAIKYNQPGGKIELIAEENDTEIIIRVRDTGIGISEQDQGHIFSKFFRSDDEEVRKRTGHGLGLSLVHEVVKLHHGEIQLNSIPGEGSEFVMSFNKESNMLKDAI